MIYLFGKHFIDAFFQTWWKWSFIIIKNKSFGSRGGYLKVTVFEKNTTQDILFARSRYLQLTPMEKRPLVPEVVISIGPQRACITHDISIDTCFWQQTSRLFLKCFFFSKRYNWISKCRSDTCLCQTQDVICLNDQTPISHLAQHLGCLLLAPSSSIHQQDHKDCFVFHYFSFLVHCPIFSLVLF